MKAMEMDLAHAFGQPQGSILVSGCGLICKTGPIDKGPAVQETISNG